MGVCVSEFEGGSQYRRYGHSDHYEDGYAQIELFVIHGANIAIFGYYKYYLYFCTRE